MDDNPENLPIDPSDDVVAKRLSQLRHRPIDTSGLARRIENEIGGRPVAYGIWGRIARSRIAAAILISAALIGALTWSFTRPATASAAELSRLHAENLAGAGTVAVQSMADAQQQIRSRGRGCPMLPDAANCQVMSCRVRAVGGKQVSCAVLGLDEHKVTVAVAFARDLKPPPGRQAVTPEGMKYVAQSEGRTTIVVTTPDDVWVAVIGDLPVERLVSVAGQLHFPAAR
jgi:hypothetical protein